MYYYKTILHNILLHFRNSEITTVTVISVLIMVAILGLFEYTVYYSSFRRSLYNRAFNVGNAIIPFFISTIILSLQSNMVVTLGTIGALAIIRFRTAIKDPIDMIFLLWSIHIGITCGCQLYEIAIITSIVVGIALFALNRLNIVRKSYLLIIRTSSMEAQDVIEQILSESRIKYRIKSKTASKENASFVIELFTKKINEITSAFSSNELILNWTIMEYDANDII